MRLEGCHDNDGCYGDETGGSTCGRLPSREEQIGISPYIDEGVGFVGEATDSYPGGKLP
jgi:hypothetical protein